MPVPVADGTQADDSDDAKESEHYSMKGSRVLKGSWMLLCQCYSMEKGPGVR